jgi:ubiquinone/menaquinone biosynthesis C-methylase UbiE
VTKSRDFNDYFSNVSADYARYRPTYPQALFDVIAEHAPAHDLAWDCATGSGQAAVGLSRRFRKVVATDASDQQLSHATPVENVEYRVARAEDSGIQSASVNAVTVAQGSTGSTWTGSMPKFAASARPLPCLPFRSTSAWISRP